MKASEEVNKAKDEMRALAEHIAGCPLGDWPFKDIERYVDLYIATCQRTLYFIRWIETNENV